MPVESVTMWRHGWWYGQGYAPLYSPICRGPCDTHMPSGPYRLALSRGGGPAVPSRDLVVVGGPSELRASYVDHSGLRALGAIIGVAGTVGGVVMIAASAGDETACSPGGYCYRRVSGPLLAGGIGVVVASAIVGSILLLQHDEAHFTVAPLTVPSAGNRLESLVAGVAPPQGAELAVRF